MLLHELAALRRSEAVLRDFIETSTIGLHGVGAEADYAPPRSTERLHRAFARADPARKRRREGARARSVPRRSAFADAPWLAWEGYHCPMDCAECEDLSRRHALATDRHMEANKRRQAYVPGEPISGREITELAHLDQEVEDTKRRRDDLAKEYARHRREAHPKGRAS